jgi:hypothetical protein
MSFGVVAAELLVALAVTNRYRARLSYRFWRRAHYLNFAVWLFALVHGLTAGTDAFTTWALMLYAGSAWLVLALTVHRATAHLGGQAARNNWEGLTKRRLCLRSTLLAPMRRPQSRPYPVDTNAPCVLASERPAHSGDERRSAKPS